MMHSSSNQIIENKLMIVLREFETNTTIASFKLEKVIGLSLKCLCLLATLSY
jgi:hypothetical protein